MYATSGAWQTVENPVITYRVVFNSFLINVHVHRAVGVVAPQGVFSNVGKLCLQNPWDGPSGKYHCITAELGPSGTLVIEDASEPGEKLLEAISGRWFVKSDREQVEQERACQQSDHIHDPNVEGRWVAGVDGRSSVHYQQPAIVLTGFEYEEEAYDAHFKTVWGSSSYQVLQPKGTPAKQTLFDTAGPGPSSGYHTYPAGPSPPAAPPPFAVGPSRPAAYPMYATAGPPPHAPGPSGPGVSPMCGHGGYPIGPASPPAYLPTPCLSSGPSKAPMPRFPPNKLGVNGHVSLSPTNEKNRANKARKRERKAAARDRENERRDMAIAAVRELANKESAAEKRLAEREKEIAALDESLTSTAMQSHVIATNRLKVVRDGERDFERRKELDKEIERLGLAGVHLSNAHNSRKRARGIGKGSAPATAPPPAPAPVPKRVPIVFKVPGRLVAPTEIASADGIAKNAGGNGIPEKSGTLHNSNQVIIHLPPQEVRRKRSPPPPHVYDMMYDYDDGVWLE